MSEHSIAKAKDIYERFVRQGSEYDINISAKMKKAVKKLSSRMLKQKWLI